MSSRRLLLASCLVIALTETLTAVGAPAPKPEKVKDGPLGMKFVSLPKAVYCKAKAPFYEGEEDNRKDVAEIKADFEIAVHTVTQGQWQAVMGNNPSYFSRDGKGKGKVKDIKDEELKQFPVESVSWEDVHEFIKKLNEKEKGRGYLYRLPSDAEWEYACRGGATSKKECSYHFYLDKPTNDLSSKQANFDGNKPGGKGEKGPNLGRTTKVGSYAPNKLGLYDMHGNVWQWCEDAAFPGNRANPHKISRGGSWQDHGDSCGAEYPYLDAPTARWPEHGFRLVRVPVRAQEK